MTMTSEALVARILGPLQRSSRAAARRLCVEIAPGPEQAADDRIGAGPSLGELPDAFVTGPARVPRTPPGGWDAWPASDWPQPGGTAVSLPGSGPLPKVVHRPLQVHVSAGLPAAVTHLAAPSRQPGTTAVPTQSSNGAAAGQAAIGRSGPGRAGNPAWSPPHAAIAPQSIPPDFRASARNGGAEAPGRHGPQPAVPTSLAEADTPSSALYAEMASAAPETGDFPHVGVAGSASAAGPVSTLERLKAHSALVRLRPVEEGGRGFVAAAPPARMAPDRNADPVSDLDLYPASSRATAGPALRGQAARIAQAVTPLLQRASGFQAPAPLDRDGPDAFGDPDVPDAGPPAPVSNVFNVNVSLGTGAESDAFRDALTDVLRDCARRQGLDV